MARLWIVLLLWLLPHAALAAPCPESPSRPEGTRIEGSKKRLASGHATTVIAHGKLALAGCADVPGEGHVPQRPQVNLMLAAAEGARLVLETASVCDTLLLVRHADGSWAFDDDGAGGLDARLVLTDAREGRYDIWIGSFAPGSCAARLTLTMD